jgi:hypothetical protein
MTAPFIPPPNDDRFARPGLPAGDKRQRALPPMPTAKIPSNPTAEPKTLTNLSSKKMYFFRQYHV